MSDSPTISDRPAYRVSIRKNWSDAWSVVPYLQCLSCTDAAAPAVPRATLRWLAGVIRYEGMANPATFVPLDLDQWFVKVDYDVNGDGAAIIRLFTGRIWSQSLDLRGDGSGAVIADEDLIALGLSQELDRDAIRGAYSTDNGTTAQIVYTDLVFNEKYIRGLREVGNRSTHTVTATVPIPVSGGADTTETRSGVYVFSNQRDTTTKLPTPWTAHDICTYLLTLFRSKDLPWALGGQTDLLDKLVLPKIRANGRTIAQVFNDLIDRKRGLGWCVRVNPDTDVPTVHVFSVFDTNITYDDVTLTANAETAALDLAALGHEPGSCRITLESAATYGAVIVSGEPLLVCFTVSFTDSTLEKAWTIDQETAYKAANKKGRTAEQYRNVYTAYRIPKAWGWQAGDGAGGSKHHVNASIDANGQVYATDLAPFPNIRNWGHLIARHLPIIETWNSDPADPDSWQPEYRKPMIFLKDENTHQYRHADRSDSAEEPTGHVRPLDREFGIQLEMSPNYLLALNQFGTAPADAPGPKYDYTHLVATVAARTDQRVDVVGRIDGNDPSHVLLIRIEDAESWLVLAGTVLDVAADGTLTRQSSAQILRDDSARLRQVCALAQAWYGKRRAAINLELKAVATGYPVGSIITAAVTASADPTVTASGSSVPVNSVVSSVDWDLVAMKTTLQTSYGDIDLAGAAGHSVHRSID